VTVNTFSAQISDQPPGCFSQCLFSDIRCDWQGIFDTLSVYVLQLLLFLCVHVAVAALHSSDFHFFANAAVVSSHLSASSSTAVVTMHHFLCSLMALDCQEVKGLLTYLLSIVKSF